MPLSVLVTADVHLGRTSTQAPALASDRLRARAAWDRVVALALNEQVAALVVAGDLIDAENRRWEVLGPLTRDISRLHRAGVRVILTGGNHDWESLRHLRDAIGGETDAIAGGSGDNVGQHAGFTLLGTNGWERTEVRRKDERLLIDGWSFMSERFEEDPVRMHTLPSAGDVPVLGIAHGEVGASAGRYAPIQRASLESRDVDAWVIGHIHRPSLVPLARGFLLSPGSPQALDFGEPGAHGAWLITVDRGRVLDPQLVPLSSVRYERLDVALDGVSQGSDAERVIVAALTDVERRCLAESGTSLEGLSLRVRLSGRAAFEATEPGHSERHLGEARANPGLRHRVMQWQGSSRLAVQVVEVVDDVLPPVDLAALAAGAESSPLVVAARLLHFVEAGRPFDQASEADFAALLREVDRRLHDVDTQQEYLQLDAGASHASAQTALASALREVLWALVRQEERP